MVALAWILSIAGAIVAYVVQLAGAMKTVPPLAWREAIGAVPLPAVAAALAAWRLLRPAAPPDGGAARSWLAAGIPLGLALFALPLLADVYFDQPGGPR